MAPDDLKFVRMEARLQEQQQQLMAELGLGSSASSKPLGGKSQSVASDAKSESAERELTIVSEVKRELCEVNMSKKASEKASAGPEQPLAGAKRRLSYGSCEMVSSERGANEPPPATGNKLAASCELAQFERNAPDARGKLGTAGRWDQTGEGHFGESVDESNESLGKEEATQVELCLVERLAKIIPCLGILMALCASFCLGTAGMLVKLVESVHGIEVAVLRAFIQLIIYVAIICMRNARRWLPERGEMLPVAARALLGGASITFSYCALKLIPLGDATTIRFSLPIWTLIMGYLFLGEACNLQKLLAVVVSISGVILVAKPDDCVRLLNQMVSLFLFPYNDQPDQIIPSGPNEEPALANGSLIQPEVPPDDNNSSSSSSSSSNNNNNGTSSTNITSESVAEFCDEVALLVESSAGPAPLKVALGPSLDPLRQFEGCSLALASSVCLAMSIIALRLCKRTPSEVTIFWLSMSSASIGSLALLLMGEWSVPRGLTDWALILLNGLCGALGQWFMTNALKVEQSGLVSLTRTFDIEVAFLYSALLLGEQIRTTSIIGSVLVSLGVIIVLLPHLIARGGGAPATCPTDRAETDSTTTSTTVSVGGRPPPVDLADLWPNGSSSHLSLDGRRSFVEANAVDLLKRRLSERVQAAAAAAAAAASAESPPASRAKPLAC